MDREIYSQSAMESTNLQTSCSYLSQLNSYDSESQTNNERDILENPSEGQQENNVISNNINSNSENIQTENTVIDKLYEDYKSVSEELTTSLREFREEKICLENELGRLNQENEYLKLEIDRQKAHINDLNEISRNLSDTLSKEEAETKKIVELKLLEIQDIFNSIDSADTYINEFKTNFSESVSEAQKYCGNIKINLKSLKENSIMARENYLNDFNNYITKCSNELKHIKKNISETQIKIDLGIECYKKKRTEEIKFKQELNDLLNEIDFEQKRKKELENGLIYYIDIIAKSKEDNCLKLNDNKLKENKLTRQISELNLSNTILKNKIEETEQQVNLLKDRYEGLCTNLNTLQAVLIKKRHDDEIIDQEIKKLEKQAEVMKKDCDIANEVIESKENIEIELKDLENQVSFMMQKCKELEESREKAVKANPVETLLSKKEALERSRTLYQHTLDKIEAAKKELNDKQEAERIITEQVDHLRNDLNEKLFCLESCAEKEKELEDLRKTNDELSLKINSCEQELEKKQKMILSIEEFIQEQKQIQDELDFSFTVDDNENDVDDDGLFENYLSVLELMKKLEVDNLDERLRRVAAAIDYNIKQKGDVIEAYQNTVAKMQSDNEETIKGLEKHVEEHKNYCEDMLVKLDSEMRYVEGKVPNVKSDIKIKKKELASHAPKLASSVNNALCLFEKIVDYYASACEERQSAGTTSIHWDNTKEVLNEILLIPIHKLSKLKGMARIDTLTATPQVYRAVITKAQQMFDTIIRERSNKPIEYSFRRLMEMRNALYYQSDNNSPGSKLNDTEYSTSNED